MSLPLWYNTIMFNIKNYTKDYKTNSEVYQLKLPLELDGFVENNDSVRLLSIILEELDYTGVWQLNIKKLPFKPLIAWNFLSTFLI